MRCSLGILLVARAAVWAYSHPGLSPCEALRKSPVVVAGTVGPTNFEFARFLGLEAFLRTFQFNIEQTIRGGAPNAKSITLPYPWRGYSMQYQFGQRLILAGAFDDKGNFLVSSVIGASKSEFSVEEALQMARGVSLVYGFITEAVPYQFVPGAKVLLQSAGNEFLLTSQSNGSFRSTNIPPGRYTVRVSKDNKDARFYPHQRWAELDVPAHGCANFGVGLVEGASIEGTVLDANGNPIPDVLVAARPDSNAVRSNALGKFQIPGLPPGRYFLFASSADFRKPATFRSSYRKEAIDLESYQRVSKIQFRLAPFGPKAPLTLRANRPKNPNFHLAGFSLSPTQNLHNLDGAPPIEFCKFDVKLECHIELHEHVEYKVTGSGPFRPFGFVAKRNAVYTIPFTEPALGAN